MEPGKALAAAVIRQRGKLGLTQKELAERANVAINTLMATEMGQRPRLRVLTKKRLERALGWELGSIDKVLEAGDPTLIQDAPASTSLDMNLETATNEDLGKFADKLSMMVDDPELGARFMRSALAWKARRATNPGGESVG